MISHIYRQESSSSSNPARTVSKVSWHFSALMAFISIGLNAMLYREIKQTALESVHKIRRWGKVEKKKSYLKYIREAKEIVGIFWAIGLGLWALFGLLGALIGSFGRKNRESLKVFCHK